MFRTIINQGEIVVSSIYRRCSSTMGGYYWETMVFKNKEIVDQKSSAGYSGCLDNHLEFMRKYITKEMLERHEVNQERIHN